VKLNNFRVILGLEILPAGLNYSIPFDYQFGDHNNMGLNENQKNFRIDKNSVILLSKF